MNLDLRDIRSTIIPKGDQLNTDQLLGGPIIITVSDVRAGSADQPIALHHALDPQRPFKPCKTVRKLLIHAWGHDSTVWVGRSMELYAEPTVKFGGEEVGGIRVARMSHIKPAGIDISLTSTKGQKKRHRVDLLKASTELTAALALIEGITDKASQNAAKAAASALTGADRESALAAYARRVDSLKAAAKAKTAGAFDLAAFTTRAKACTDEAALQVLSDEVETMPEGADKDAALQALRERDDELAGDA